MYQLPVTTLFYIDVNNLLSIRPIKIRLLSYCLRKMYLFIITHLGSGASLFSDSLSDHPRCHHAHRDTYKSIHDLMRMKEYVPFQKIYFDKLTFNFQFSCPSLYKQCEFIYIVREPTSTLNYIYANKGYSESGSVLYYTYRLRRIYEMAYRTPRRMILTFDDLLTPRGLSSIQEHLGLRDEFKCDYNPTPVDNNVSLTCLQKAQTSYDYYLAKLMQLHR